MKKLKELTMRLIFSRFGPSVTSSVSVATGFLLGWIVSGTSAIGMHLDATQQTTVSLAISQTLYWLISELVNKYAGDKASALQSALKQYVPSLKVDNWIGDETVTAAQETAQQAAVASLEAGEVYQGKPVTPTKPAPKPKRKRYL